MEDYRETSSNRRSQIRRNMEQLQRQLKSTSNPFQKSSIAGELGKLEKERMQLDSLFDEEPEEEAEEEAPEEQFPILNQIYRDSPELLRKSQHLERDVRASILYLHRFEAEFIGMFTSRKLRLDVKYSVERDTFYDIYHQVARTLMNYRTEADRIAEGSYAKQYEADVLKRKVEMRHATLVEVEWFFRRLRRFSKQLVTDIAGDGILCQNPHSELEYDTLDREKLLRNRSVAEALQMLWDFSSEAVAYLDIPEFQQKAL
ncbi:MAG: hypothetical protein ACLFP4_02930 [Spirochaetales bacterium]